MVAEKGIAGMSRDAFATVARRLCDVRALHCEDRATRTFATVARFSRLMHARTYVEESESRDLVPSMYILCSMYMFNNTALCSMYIIKILVTKEPRWH